MKLALKDMKNGKTDGNDGIVAELIKYTGRKTCEIQAKLYKDYL